MSDNDLPNEPADRLDIDARARSAGGELRRPAPVDLVASVHRARRRQQAVRAGMGAVGVAAIVGVGAIVLNGDGEGGTLIPASVPESTVSTVSTVTTVVATSTVPPTSAGVSTPTTAASAPDSTVAMTTLAPAAAPPTVAPIGTDADGVPDAVYAFANADLTEQHVIDPLTLEVIETRPAAFTPPAEPLSRVSASGAVRYATPFDTSAEFDACGQRPVTAWVTGAAPTGLPDRVELIEISANGRVGVVLSGDCAGDGASLGEVTVSVFDADRPDIAARPILTVDETVEVVFLGGRSLSDDGSYLIVSSFVQPLVEGIAAHLRVIDTATGEVVADNATDTAAEYPRVDCTDEFLPPQFVGSTAIAYGALCPDGIAVVIRDLASGESIDVLNREYAGRSYETMVSASLSVDRLTYRDPAAAWYLLCAERETQQGDTIVVGAAGSNPCWIGHGNEPMRELPTATTIAASFQPLG
jgi:hypothetical protein